MLRHIVNSIRLKHSMRWLNHLQKELFTAEFDVQSVKHMMPSKPWTQEEIEEERRVADSYGSVSDYDFIYSHITRRDYIKDKVNKQKEKAEVLSRSMRR